MHFPIVAGVTSHNRSTMNNVYYLHIPRWSRLSSICVLGNWVSGHPNPLFRVVSSILFLRIFGFVDDIP